MGRTASARPDPMNRSNGAAGGLSPEPRRGSGGVLDGYGEKRSFVIASDSRGKNKSMGTASGFQPFIRT